VSSSDVRPKVLFRPAQTRRSFEDAIEQIAEAIQAGDLQVGDRLPSERSLASQMEISRPTLREAIRVLSEAGIVDVKPGPGGGMFILSDHVPLDVLSNDVAFRISEVAEVLEARRLIEPRVAQLAALRATEADFEAMERTIELQRVRPIADERFVQLDIRFHTAIARATQNETVVGLMRALLRRLELARQSAMRSAGDLDEAVDIHVRTLAAIMSGDPEAVEVAMDEHLSFLETRWQEETGRARLRKIPAFLLPLGESVR
jgi:GntR family transcriptional regulator, transcriptional repressor for pyruvate dehydrogenase complex